MSSIYLKILKIDELIVNKIEVKYRSRLDTKFNCMMNSSLCFENVEYVKGLSDTKLKI